MGLEDIVGIAQVNDNNFIFLINFFPDTNEVVGFTLASSTFEKYVY